MKKLSKAKLWDYFILTSRFLLAIIFIMYGAAKLTGGQFGIAEEEMLRPLKDLSLFKVGWYLFDHQPFKFITGVGEIICGLLLLYNRTTLLGALMFIPICFTILLIDVTIMPKPMAEAFFFRLSFYLFLDALILYHYRDRMKQVLNLLTNGVSTKFRYPIWMFLLLPVGAILLELPSVILKALYHLVTNPKMFFESIKQMVEMIF